MRQVQFGRAGIRRVAIALLGVGGAIAAIPARAPVPANRSVAPERWSVRPNEWFISVDGIEVAVPVDAQPSPARPPAAPALGPLPYDGLIVRHAAEHGLDWRLLAALIFEESRFDADAVSPAGAYGLMQVRPIAAAAVGSTKFVAPAHNIETGARYLRQLGDLFARARGRDHLALVLAAYNAGPGHVRDAQALARRFGYDPLHWSGAMERILPLLEYPVVYAQLPKGFARGRTTVAYVNRVLARYDDYRRTFAASPEG
jgi:soluble lytic murein transglycosylase-like protein